MSLSTRIRNSTPSITVSTMMQHLPSTAQSSACRHCCTAPISDTGPIPTVPSSQILAPSLWAEGHMGPESHGWTLMNGLSCMDSHAWTLMHGG